MPKAQRTIVFVLLLLLAATAAQALQFTVTLKNGTTFETRYRPVQAEWDPNVLMLMTDLGNWIALEQDDVVDVVSHAEESGFGFQLNTTTLFLGWSPNDLVNDQEGGEQRYEVGADTGGGNYSIDQFLNVPVVGSAAATGGGIPVVSVTDDAGN